MKNTANKNDESDDSRWVTFFLEKERYGINVMQVQEVLRPSVASKHSCPL